MDQVTDPHHDKIALLRKFALNSESLCHIQETNKVLNMKKTKIIQNDGLTEWQKHYKWHQKKILSPYIIYFYGCEKKNRFHLYDNMIQKYTSLLFDCESSELFVLTKKIIEYV